VSYPPKGRLSFVLDQTPYEAMFAVRNLSGEVVLCGRRLRLPLVDPAGAVEGARTMVACIGTNCRVPQ
jgi:hypothetical protein